MSAGADAASRFRVVVPENASRLPPTISLASALLYSPRCLRLPLSSLYCLVVDVVTYVYIVCRCLSRIRHYMKGKAAYLVPHVAGPEDKRLALLLKVPLLCGDPTTIAPLYTKSGITRMLAAADVATPKGDYLEHH